mgnify:CR=1 FL=1
MTSCLLSIFRLGYIGLPTAALIAESGLEVNGVDISKNIVNKINKGDIHIFEPNLKEIVQKVVKKGFLKASTRGSNADVFIITVPTPLEKNKIESPKPDISFVIQAAKEIAKFIQEGNLVILESTCPVKTTENIYNLIKEESYISNFEIAYCPERVIPGNIFNELKNNSRVIGGLTPKASQKSEALYKIFCKGKILCTDAKTAELVKLTENSYRNTNIAFANEISIIATEYGINPYELITLTNYHPRVNILNPGCGVGGHCIAIDPKFLISDLPELSLLTRISCEVNDKKTKWVTNEIISNANQFLKSKNREPVIGIFGITFKSDVDDIRESPAIKIVESLFKNGNDLLICEPNLEKHNEFNLIDIKYALNNSDILVFLVKHSKFKSLNIDSKICLDFCGLGY